MYLILKLRWTSTKADLEIKWKYTILELSVAVAHPGSFKLSKAKEFAIPEGHIGI